MIDISKDPICTYYDLMKAVKCNAPSADIEAVCAECGGISRIDGLFLYGSILTENPDYVIEFSPEKGYSTMCIARAMKALGKPGRFATFEKNQRVKSHLEANITNNNIEAFVHVVWGNALEEIPKWIANNHWTNQVGFMFVDSNHSEEFAQQYINTIFPLLKKNALVAVHDIGATSLDPRGEFNETLFPRGGKCGEYKAIKKYLSNTNKPYILLHAMFGGKHEASTKLPLQKDIYNNVSKIIDHKVIVDIPPKSIIFRV